MNMGIEKPKVLVVVGPTASGKTGVAIELAKRFNGEVISADSRQVYKGMDIGSAKVTFDEMQGIAHHLLDVADPKYIYTASDFKRDAEIAIADIISRGKLPIIAGGTFFYVDTLLGKVSLPEVEPDEELRAELEEKDTTELFAILQELDPKRAGTIEPENPRRLIRAIEVARKLGQVPEPKEIELPYEIFTIGLTVDMETHADILRKRLDERLEAGMIEEVETLLASGVPHERLEKFGLEYRYASRYLRGEIDYETMKDEIVTKSRQFAKRQISWLKRDLSINWFNKNDTRIFDQTKQFLGND